MEIRDAREADAKRLATLADAPIEVMGDLIHDRTVRVADEEGIVGFVSFDAGRDAVYVTRFEGSPAVLERLLCEPARFGTREGMAVELLVEDTGDELLVEDTGDELLVEDTGDELLVEDSGGERAATGAGFEKVGAGPRFDGVPTTKFRLEP